MDLPGSTRIQVIMKSCFDRGCFFWGHFRFVIIPIFINLITSILSGHSANNRPTIDSYTCIGSSLLLLIFRLYSRAPMLTLRSSSSSISKPVKQFLLKTDNSSPRMECGFGLESASDMNMNSLNSTLLSKLYTTAATAWFDPSTRTFKWSLALKSCMSWWPVRLAMDLTCWWTWSE